MTFELDPKAVRFLIDAVQSKILELTNRQNTHANDENIVSEASNDIMYYKSLIAKLSE
jgi:hypothetical protein